MKTPPTPGSKKARAARRAYVREAMAKHPGLAPMQAVLADVKELCEQLRTLKFRKDQQ